MIKVIGLWESLRIQIMRWDWCFIPLKLEDVDIRSPNVTNHPLEISVQWNIRIRDRYLKYMKICEKLIYKTVLCSG